MDMKTPMDFVRYVEKTQGTLNIYEEKLKARISDEELHKSLYEYMGDIFDEMYGSMEDAKTGIERDFSTDKLVRMIYEPFVLRWAQSRTQVLMKSDWSRVEDIFVGPVTIPVFNAAAIRCNNQFDVILLNLPLFESLPGLDGILWQAFDKWINMQWQEFPRLRREFASRIHSVLNTKHQKVANWLSKGDIFSLRVSTMSCLIQTLFILLHEYAHVILGHLNEGNLNSKNFLSEGLHGVRYYTQSQEEEFEADQQASEWLFCNPIDMLLTEDTRLSTDTYMTVPYSLVFLFVIFSEMERQMSVKSSTHPPAMGRLQRLLKVVERSEQYSDTISTLRNLVEFLEPFVRIA